MSINRPRVQLILDKDIYSWIKYEAKKRGVSLSLAIRDALRKEYEEWLSAQDLLSDSGFMKAYYQGIKDIANNDVADWRKIRKDV